MARNEEKALTLFSKWQTFKKEFHADASNRRPLLASDCNSIVEAEKWRRELVREVTKKIAAIHNATLGEHRIRELNDEINKMMKQKHFWEIRIRELGGEIRQGKQFYDVEGQELPGAPGYRYYGAAKELPGVRELFAEKEEEEEFNKSRKTRGDLYKHITPDYYGYRDEEDGILVPKESARERELLELALEEGRERRRRLQQDSTRSGGVFGGQELMVLEREESEGEDEEDVYAMVCRLHPSPSTSSSTSSLSDPDGIGTRTEERARSLVQVPEQEEMDKAVLETRRQMLLDKLA